MTSEASNDVDKQQLYGKFQTVEDWNKARLKWQDELYKKAAYKSLDIGDPDDVGDINVEKYGLDATGLAQVLAAVKPKSSGLLKWGLMAAGLATGGGLLAAPAIIEALKPDPAPVVVPNDPPEFTDTDTQFQLNLGKPE